MKLGLGIELFDSIKPLLDQIKPELPFKPFELVNLQTFKSFVFTRFEKYKDALNSLRKMMKTIRGCNGRYPMQESASLYFIALVHEKIGSTDLSLQTHEKVVGSGPKRLGKSLNIYYMCTLQK